MSNLPPIENSHFISQGNINSGPFTGPNNPRGSNNTQMNNVPQRRVSRTLTPPVHMEQPSLDYGPGDALPPQISPQYPAMAILSNHTSQLVLRYQSLPHESQSAIGLQRCILANTSPTESSNNLLTTVVCNQSSRTPHTIVSEHQRHTATVNTLTSQTEIHTSSTALNQIIPEGLEGTDSQREVQEFKSSFVGAEVQVARVYSTNDTNRPNNSSTTSSQWPLPENPILITENLSAKSPRSHSARPSAQTPSLHQRSVPNFSRPLPPPPLPTKENPTINITNYRSVSTHTRNLKCRYCSRSGHVLEQCSACTYCAGKAAMSPEHELFECPMYELYEPGAFSDAFFAHIMRCDFVPPDASHGTRLEASAGYGIHHST